MRTCLVSHDEKLVASLREVLGNRFLLSAPGEPRPQADLYVWDLENFSEFPDPSAFATARHLFLIERRDLATLGRRLQSHDGCILLKPVNRATLEAFFIPNNEGPNNEELPGATDKAEEDKTTTSLRSERDALLDYVLSANLKLQEYDKDRTNFLARAIHDLRAPLTSLHGYCGLLLDGELGPINSRQAELLARMQSSSERLATLAGSLLALSVEGYVQRNLELEQGDVEACLSQALEDLSSNLDDKHLSVDTQFDPPEQPIFFERKQIEQVLMNLIENACKFSPRRGVISLRGSSVFWDPENHDLDDSAQASNAYRIDVLDSGPGVDPALSEKIFEQYMSCMGSNDRSGVGLGLAICKLIIAAHGGRIWANPSKDGGSFSFVLPFEPKSVHVKRGVESVPVTEGFKIVASA